MIFSMIADEFTAFTSSIFLTLFTAQLNCIMSYDVGQPWRVVGSSARGGSTCFCPLGNSWYRVVVEVEVVVVVVVAGGWRLWLWFWLLWLVVMVMLLFVLCCVLFADVCCDCCSLLEANRACSPCCRIWYPIGFPIENQE